MSSSHYTSLQLLQFAFSYETEHAEWTQDLSSTYRRLGVHFVWQLYAWQELSQELFNNNNNNNNNDKGDDDDNDDDGNYNFTIKILLIVTKMLMIAIMLPLSLKSPCLCMIFLSRLNIWRWITAKQVYHRLRGCWKPRKPTMITDWGGVNKWYTIFKSFRLEFQI